MDWNKPSLPRGRSLPSPLDRPSRSTGSEGRNSREKNAQSSEGDWEEVSNARRKRGWQLDGSDSDSRSRPDAVRSVGVSITPPPDVLYCRVILSYYNVIRPYWVACVRKYDYVAYFQVINVCLTFYVCVMLDIPSVSKANEKSAHLEVLYYIHILYGFVHLSRR